MTDIRPPRADGQDVPRNPITWLDGLLRSLPPWLSGFIGATVILSAVFTAGMSVGGMQTEERVTVLEDQRTTTQNEMSELRANLANLTTQMSGLANRVQGLESIAAQLAEIGIKVARIDREVCLSQATTDADRRDCARR